MKTIARNIATVFALLLFLCLWYLSLTPPLDPARMLMVEHATAPSR
ncbi:MAG: hypothetical protein AB7O65_14635 [Candidatus Korobacteraceae bacterium]